MCCKTNLCCGKNLVGEKRRGKKIVASSCLTLLNFERMIETGNKQLRLPNQTHYRNILNHTTTNGAKNKIFTLSNQTPNGLPTAKKLNTPHSYSKHAK